MSIESIGIETLNSEKVEHSDLVRTSDGRVAVRIDKEGAVLRVDNFLTRGFLDMGGDRVPIEVIYMKTEDNEIYRVGRDGEVSVCLQDEVTHLGSAKGRIEMRVGEKFNFDRIVRVDWDDEETFSNSFDSSPLAEIFAVVEKVVKEDDNILGIGSELDDSVYLLEREGKISYEPLNPWWEYELCFLVPDDIDSSEKRSVVKSRIQAFQEKLIWQKEGIAESIEKIYNAITQNPEISYVDYVRIRDSFASEYLLSEEYLGYFDNAFKSYQEKHRIVNLYKEKYPDNGDLFEACFGDKPLGEIEVLKGPMSLHFRCLDFRDYAFIDSIYSNGGDRDKVTSVDEVSAYQSGGCAFPAYPLKPELSGVLSVERGDVVEVPVRSFGLDYIELLFMKQDESVRIHEEQHLFNDLFKPDENKTSLWGMMLRFSEHKVHPEYAEVIVHGLVENKRRELVDSRARDEILAYYRGGSSLEETTDTLSNNNLYDYSKQFSEDIELIPQEIRELFERFFDRFDNPDFKKMMPKISNSEIKNQVDKVFGEEYKRDLKIWIESISILEKKGFTREQILNLLYQEPVNSWINLARRMRERA